MLASVGASAEEFDVNAQANNPLASLTAFNLQNYYIGRLTDAGDDANQFWLRFATPFSLGKTSWLLRASLPYNSFPVPPERSTQSGLGDVNVFGAYLFDTGSPVLSFGLGPQITAPTVTDDRLGTEKWSAGFANVLFNARSSKFQYGDLLIWQHSFAGPGSREDVNFLALQPFGFYQLGGGIYLKAAPIWAFNLRNGDYSVPLGAGIGQVIKRGMTVFNLFVEPQFSVADEGPGQPEWQVFFALNTQFPK